MAARNRRALNFNIALPDRYFNCCLPTPKLLGKERCAARVKKTFDTAKTPVARLIELDVLTLEQSARLQAYQISQDPLALYQQLDRCFPYIFGKNDANMLSLR